MTRSPGSRTGASPGPDGQAAATPAREAPAWASLRTWAVFLSLTGAGAAADLVSKHVAFACLIDAPRRSVAVVPGVLDLTLNANKGIAFGIEVPPWLVLAATVVAMSLVVGLFLTSPARAWGLHLGLALVLAGSIGNLYDRVWARVWFPGEPQERVGQVRDFVDLNLGFMRWPAFNVADVLLVVGVALILVHMLRTRKPAR